MKTYYVYMMATDARTTYIGVTNDLERRVWEHRHGEGSGFTSRYGLRKLVCIEDFKSIDDGIAREKQLKSWRRVKKLALIDAQNPAWDDLAAGWYE